MSCAGAICRTSATRSPPLCKHGYLARVRHVLRTRKAQRVACNIAMSFKKTCLEVVAKKGAAARG